MPNFVEKDDLARANSSLSIGWQLGMVVGSALGGVLFERYGASTVFALNAASFVVSSGLIASIRAPFSEGSERTEQEDHPGALAGFRFTRRDSILLALIVVWALAFFAVDIVLVAEPALVRELGSGAIGYGLLASGWGVGQILGAAVARRLTERTEGRALILEMVLGAVGLAVIAVAPSLAIAIAGMGLIALFDALGTVAGNSLIQRRTPDSVRGRVFAAYSAAGWAGNSIAFIVGGFVVELLGPRGAYWLGSAVSLVGTAVLFATFGWRVPEAASGRLER